MRSVLSDVIARDYVHVVRLVRRGYVVRPVRRIYLAEDLIWV